MKKLKRKHFINFTDAPGKFWYLAWIGKIHFKKKNHKVQLYFINTSTADDKNLNFDFVEIVKVSTSHLSEYKLGVVYSIEDNSLTNYQLSDFCQNTRISVSKILNPTKNESLLSKGLTKILDSEDLDLIYYKYYINKSKTKKNIYALLTPYTILQYYLFKTDGLIKIFLSINIFNCFKYNYEHYYTEKDTNKKVVELYYDDDKLTYSEASIIAPFIFMKDKLGLKFIYSIYSRIFETVKKEKKGYLNFNFDFIPFEMYFKSKYLNSIDNDIFYLANEINLSQINQTNLFKVDKILLFPFKDKSSTKDRKNHKEINVTRSNYNILDGGVLLNLHQESNNNYQSIKESLSQESYNNLFKIEIKKIKRETQLNAYNVNNITTDINVDECVRDFESYQSSESVIKEKIDLILLGNYDYFKKVIELLKNDEDIIINRDPLKYGEKNYPVKIANSLIDIIEVLYANKCSYIIEFGSGLIGIFDTNQKISTTTLVSIIVKFIHEQVELEKNKLLWTHIFGKKNFYYKEYNVNIKMGVKHSRYGIKKDDSNTAVQIIETTKRVLQRIKNNS